MNKLKLAFLILLLGVVSAALADEVPIEDMSTTLQQAPRASNSSLDQKIAQLEQQMQNITQMNMPAKIDALQQQVQQLQGKVDTDNHQIEQLKQQLGGANKAATAKAATGSVAALGAAEAATAAVDNDATAKSFDPELKSYQDAFNSLRNKNYPAAITKMKAYLNHYPKGKYDVNAHYWLGEIYYLQAEMQQATSEFQTVVNNYPDSAKVPDALLKLAMIYSSQGDYKRSHQMFQKIKTKYPDSAAARLMANQPEQVQKSS